MYSGIIIYGIIIIAVIVGVVAVIGFLVRMLLGKAGGKSQRAREKFLDIFISREDILSQFYFLFSIIFLGLAIHSINRKFSNPLSWQTVVFLTSGAGLFIGYYYKVIYTAFAGAAGLAFWWTAKAIAWTGGNSSRYFEDSREELIKPSAMLFGMLLVIFIFYLIGRWHEGNLKYKRLALLYSVAGIFFSTGYLFFYSTKAGIYTLQEITSGRPLYASWQITISLLVFGLAFLTLAFLLFSKKLILGKELIGMGFIILIFFILLISPKIDAFTEHRYYYGGGSLSSIGVFWAIIFNLAVFFEILGVIFMGYIKKENYLVNLGMFFMFILILVKYFDWFFESLDKSIFFILAGILLFAVGWFMERGRRYLISNMKSGEIIFQQNQ